MCVWSVGDATLPHCYCKIRLRLSRLLLHYGVTNSHFFYTFYIVVSLLHTVSNISKIVSIMVSQNSHCCYTFYIMVSLLLTVSNISKTKSIMVSINSHFVSLVTLWSHCAELTKRCKSKELYILL